MPCRGVRSHSTTSSSVSSSSTSSRPGEALALLDPVLKPSGTITVIEGDHGSTYFHAPDSPAARAAIQCQVTLQERAGGNCTDRSPALPAHDRGWFRGGPRLTPDIYVDSSRDDLVDGFTRKTFTAMIEGIREAALSAGLIDPASFDAGVRDLHRTTEADGVFCYTFFKGVAAKPNRLNLTPKHDRGAIVSSAPRTGR